VATVPRWVDYWDANRIGAATVQGFKQPDENFPADFGESLVGEVASDRVKQAAQDLNRALAAHDAAGAAALFAPDATFTDPTAHVRVAGPRDITSTFTHLSLQARKGSNSSDVDVPGS
jgi:hypothetical protein